MARQIKLPGTLAKRAAHFALAKNAHDITIIDLRKIKNAFADYFVICSCDSDTHVRAVSAAVQEGMHELGQRPFHVEGEQVGQWVLIDFADIVVHVFHKHARTYYNLERLWGDGKIEKIAEE